MIFLRIIIAFLIFSVAVFTYDFVVYGIPLAKECKARDGHWIYRDRVCVALR